MGIDEIMSSINRSFREDDFIPVYLFKNEGKKKEIEQSLKIEPLIDHEELSRRCEELDIDINHVYVVTEGAYDRYAYIDLDLGLYVSMFDGSIAYGQMAQISRLIKGQRELLKKNWEDKEYRRYFGMIEARTKLIMLNKRYFDVPKLQRYRIFTDVYSSLEYGFSEINPAIYEDIKTLRPKEETLALSTQANPQGYLTIYRGVTSKSTPVEEANSWSLNLSVASFFATRYNESNPVIYEAQVHLSDIVAMIKHRGESELIVMPKDIINIQDMGFLGIDDLLYEYPEVIDDIVSTLKKESFRHFNRDSNLHGENHTKRVLFHSLILAEMEELPPEWRPLLKKIALYHDIGRVNDGVDDDHGVRGYEKVVELNLLKKFTNEDKETIRYVIENHCLDDDKVIEIAKYETKDEEKAKTLLEILKDADALDRVRLKDLDPKFLRTGSAMELILAAQQLINYKL